MDFNIFCGTDAHGYYTIVFPNKYCLGNEEIETFFYKYKGFVDVKSAGEGEGLRFVRFEGAEGAKEAINATRFHPNICLIPYIRKKRYNRPKKKNNSDEDHDRYDDRDPHSSGQQQQKGKKKRNNRRLNRELEECDEYWICHRRANNVYEFLPPKKIPEPTNSKTRSISAKTFWSFDKCSLMNSYNDPDDKEKFTRYEVANCVKPTELPILLAHSTEVIVGNIHSYYNSTYIFLLFEKYDPFAISETRFVSARKIQYCFVYFRSYLDAIAAEREYDDHDLSGKKLFVMRTQALKYMHNTISRDDQYSAIERSLSSLKV